MAQLGICVICLAFVGSGFGFLDFDPNSADSKSLINQHNSNEIGENMIDYFRKLNIPSDNQKASTAFMVKLYNVLQSGSSIVKAAGRGNLNQDDLTLSNTIRGFAPTEILQARQRSRMDMRFNIPLLPSNERLRLAEVRYFRHNSLNLKTKKLKVKIKIFKGGIVINKFTMRVKPMSQDYYYIYDVSRALTPFINAYHGNVTISIKLPLKRMKHQSIDPQRYMMVFYLENNTFLKNIVENFKDKEVVNESKDSSREKRSIHERKQRHKKRRRNKTGKRGGCQLLDSDVNFNSIGWGQWIIHPTRFNAKVCDGKCSSPINSRNKPTNHAMLQSLMKTKRSKTAPAPAPCCVPTMLEPMSMMYIEHDEIVVRHHEDMIAAECGCR